MGDLKSYPLAEDAPISPKNTFFKPESGPAMKELDKKRKEEGEHESFNGS